MCDSLDDKKKEHLKKRTTKEKKKSVIALEMITVSKINKERKMDKRLQTLDERSNIFNDVQM